MRKLLFLLLILISCVVFAAGVKKTDVKKDSKLPVFQRIQLNLRPQSEVTVKSSSIDRYIELSIRYLPENIEETVKNGIKPGMIVEKYESQSKNGFFLIKIFVKAEELDTFYGIDKATGIFVLDMGEKNKITAKSKMENIDDKPLKIQADLINKDIVKASLLFQSHNFYFTGQADKAFINLPVNYNTEYPAVKGDHPDAVLYNYAAGAMNTGEYDTAEQHISTLYKTYLRAPAFAMSDFLKADLERHRLLERENGKQKPKRREWVALYNRFRAAVSANPDSYLAPWGYLNMGEINYRLGMIPEGSRDFYVVIERYPQSEYRNMATLRYAEFLLSKREYENCVNILTEIKHENNEYEIFSKNTMIGLATKMLGRGKESLEFFGKIKEDADLTTLSDSLLMNAGESLIISGNYAHARDFYIVIEKRNKKNNYTGMAKLRIADTHLAEGNIQKALDEYGETQNDYPNKEAGRLAQFQIKEIESYMRGKELDLQEYFEAIRKAKTNFEYSVFLFKLAIKMYRSNELANSVETLATLIEKFPDSIAGDMARETSYTIFKTGVEKLYSQEKYEDIVNVWQMIPEFMIKHPDIRYLLMLLGKSFNSLYLYDSATKVFDEILKLKGNDAFYKYVAVLNLIDNYINLKEGVKAGMAINYYNVFMKDSSDFYPVFLRLEGEYYEKLKSDTAAAIIDYKKAIELEPYDSNKLILSSKIASIYYDKNDFKNALKYSSPVFAQFKKFPQSYFFLEYGSVVYLMSLIMENRMDEFQVEYAKTIQSFDPDIREKFDIVSMFDFIEKNSLDKAGKMIGNKKFNKMQPFMEDAKNLLSKKETLKKKESDFMDTFKEYLSKIKWYKDKE